MPDAAQGKMTEKMREVERLEHQRLIDFAALQGKGRFGSKSH